MPGGSDSNGRRSYSEDEYLMLSGIQHFSYCPRQWALIHVEGIWDENLDTTEGELFHERAHLEGYTCSKGIVSVRSMRLSNKRLGIIGYSDVIEFVPGSEGAYPFEDGAPYSIVPVEYKKGAPKAGLCDKLQIAAQALCLEEMYGAPVPDGCLYYGATRRRLTVQITDKLREGVIAAFDKMHDMIENRSIPKPVAGARCARCSLKNKCVPESSGKSVRAYWNAAGLQWREP